jgi:hypothetical protein
MSDEFLQNVGIETSDKSILKNLTALGEKLKELKKTMILKQDEADAAKKEYEHYANVILPQEMLNCNVEALSLSSGGTIKIKRNYYCQPNKNLEDRAKIAQWLKEHGGEYLIEEACRVDKTSKDKLNAAGIPFIYDSTVNTTKLKSFIKDKLGVSTGTKSIEMEDIPACIHFQEVTTVEMEV